MDIETEDTSPLMLDCQREHCNLIHLDNPTRWCRACLLRVLERAKRRLDVYGEWKVASRGLWF